MAGHNRWPPSVNPFDYLNVEDFSPLEHEPNELGVAGFVGRGLPSLEPCLRILHQFDQLSAAPPQPTEHAKDDPGHDCYKNQAPE